VMMYTNGFIKLTSTLMLKKLMTLKGLCWFHITLMV
jgi:hypothetical protein